MIKVLFFNNWHNGDVHMSRAYVVHLMQCLGDLEYHYFHKNNPKLLADIPNLRHTSTMIEADILIDTWIGQYFFTGAMTPWQGCNFPNYHAVMARVYDSLTLSGYLKPAEQYLPVIDYRPFDIGNIDRYFAANDQPHVLVCNNATMSGQAPEVDFHTLLEQLAGTHPDVCFLVSNNDGYVFSHPGIRYCSELIDNPATRCDLNEISYISTKCQLIVGRSSGPYSFAITHENMQSNRFFCICNNRHDAWFLEHSTNIAWTNQADTAFLATAISNAIPKTHKEKPMDATYYGQFNPPVDALIRSYFPDQQKGNCIEVGAVDGIFVSNTLHFERNGWDALCIEPIPQYYAKLKQNRKNALNYAAASANSDDVKFTVVNMSNDNQSSISGLEVDERLMESHSPLNPTKEVISVKTRRLDWCIENYFNHETIDFISIDTEGNELDVLKSFDVNKYNIKLLIIENNFNDDTIEKYLDELGWVKDQRVVVNDFYVKKPQALTELFTLGDLYVSDFLADNESPRHAPVEMKMMLEESTGAVKLERSAPPGTMYGKYWYRSGINNTMKTELGNIVTSILDVTKYKENDLWIDIACNDGTLLSFVPRDFIRIGIDPADDSFKADSEKVSNLIIQDFFSAKVFTRSKFGRLKAKVVTSIAMFYDLEDPKSFIDDVAEVLDQDGVWVMQLSYTPLMLEQLAFDNICHEHIYYYSLFNLQSLLNHSGFDVVDVQLNDVNGGSFRVYAMKQGANKRLFGTQPYRDVCDFRVKSLLAYEKTLNLDKKETWLDFYARINTLKKDLVEFITAEKAQGKTVWGYGASTKGNTLLQYFGLDHTLIDGIAERSIHKFGLRTVGTNIPIHSEDEMRRAKPDYLLVLPWHFINEFVAREKDFLDKGGKFIVPCPKFQIIGR
jgi:FkbM family methyltransferase